MSKLVQSSPDKRQDVFAEIMHPEITKAMEAADAESNADTPVPMPTADPEKQKVLRFAMQRPALYLNELEACMEQILAETLEEAEKTA